MNSVYIHIPFCSNICTYCAFTKYYYNENRVLTYLNSLEKEIKERYKNDLIKTIYIGGGSPSSLNIKELEKLFEIIKLFRFSNDIEFTIEVNPSDIDEEKLILFKNNKVNRISIGVESTNNKYLKYLGRKHDYDLIKDKINLVKKYFNNINIDLIYGLKYESLKDLKIDLDNIINLDVNHISTYSLMIEPHTILNIKKEKYIPEELDRDMYDLICNKLKEKGFIHYEISNFSKPNYESKHNLVYWNNESYYGFGLSSSGYINNIRYQNTTYLKEYNNFKYVKEREVLSKEDIISYELILGFRKIKGINKKDFYNKYHIDIHSLYNINELLEKELLKENNNYIYINYNYIYISNSILINFVGDYNGKE